MLCAQVESVRRHVFRCLIAAATKRRRQRGAEVISFLEWRPHNGKQWRAPVAAAAMGAEAAVVVVPPTTLPQ